MILDETAQKIKEDLPRFINGDYDKNLTPDQIKYAIKLSFLYNYTTFINDSVIFKYRDITIKISGVSNIPSEWKNEQIFSAITNEEDFKNSLKSFLREHKLNNLGI